MYKLTSKKAMFLIRTPEDTWKTQMSSLKSNRKKTTLPGTLSISLRMSSFSKNSSLKLRARPVYLPRNMVSRIRLWCRISKENIQMWKKCSLNRTNHLYTLRTWWRHRYKMNFRLMKVIGRFLPYLKIFSSNQWNKTLWRMFTITSIN